MIFKKRPLNIFSYIYTKSEMKEKVNYFAGI